MTKHKTIEGRVVIDGENGSTRILVETKFSHYTGSEVAFAMAAGLPVDDIAINPVLWHNYTVFQRGFDGHDGVSETEVYFLGREARRDFESRSGKYVTFHAHEESSD